MSKQEGLIGQQEAQRLLGVSERQLTRLLKSEDERGNPQVPLPSYVVGARRKFYASEIREWLKNNGRKHRRSASNGE